MYSVTKQTAMKGFTLIELLIAMALGILLSLGLVQIFQSTTNLAQTETALSRVQEAGRFAMDAVVKDLRMIGYHGCADPNNMDVTVMAANGVGNFESTTLQGYEIGSSGTFAPALTSGDDLEVIELGNGNAGSITARPDSDVIRMKFASRTGASLSGNTAPNNANIQVDSNPTGLSQGDLAIVSDCTSAHIFRITNVTTSGGSSNVTMAHAIGSGQPGGGNVTNKMEPGYSTGASLLSFQDLTFFVADTGRNTSRGDDVYALYRILNGGNPEELVEGVEFLQLQYGEVLASGNTRFVDANTAGVDFSEVASIRMGMLVQSLEVGLPEDDTTSYTVAGTTIAASGAVTHSGGQYLRKPFVATVKLRNKRS